jgi:chromosome partitioning protein
MKKFAFALQKGGTGKTSLAVSFAAEMANHGRTLLIDCDSQGNASSWLTSEIDRELADVLYKDCEPEDAIKDTQVPGLFLLGTAGLGGRLLLFSETLALAQPFCLQKLLDKIQDKFDYCVMDLSPGFSGMEKAALVAADEAVAVCQLDGFSLDGLQIFTANLAALKDNLNSKKPHFSNIALNALDLRIKQQLEILEQFKVIGGYDFYVYPVDQAFKKAQISQTPLQQMPGVKAETLETLREMAKSLK